MSEFTFNTPILFMIFNRPDTTRRVFERIKQIKPPVLLISADGPRKDRPQEYERCQQCRDIIKEIDWECRVETNFSDVNLGCKKRVSSAITWAFDLVDRAIILEDDILVDMSFFRFCQEMLEKYKDDERIMMVSGNDLGRNDIGDASYGFSSMASIWGWATWRRAWKKYDVEMKLWPEAQKMGLLQQTFFRKRVIEDWTSDFQNTYDGKIDTWDYQWLFCQMLNRGMGIVPKYNMVENIGFREDATHTTNVDYKFNVYSMDFPLKHPKLFFPVELYEGRERCVKEQVVDILIHFKLYGIMHRLYKLIKS